MQKACWRRQHMRSFYLLVKTNRQLPTGNSYKVSLRVTLQLLLQSNSQQAFCMRSFYLLAIALEQQLQSKNQQAKLRKLACAEATKSRSLPVFTFKRAIALEFLPSKGLLLTRSESFYLLAVALQFLPVGCCFGATATK